MKTRICHRTGQIALVHLGTANKHWDCNRLAEMTLYEGTGCWQVVDIRLRIYPQASKYGCSVGAADYFANIRPENEIESQLVKRMLNEYYVDSDGVIHWCSFNGIVRGHSHVKGYRPGWLSEKEDFAGFHSRTEGLALLKQMKEFWDQYEGDPTDVKIENVNRQATDSQVLSMLIMHRMGRVEIVEDIINKAQR